MNGPADPNLMVMEKDTVQEFTASENPQPKAKPEKEEEPVEDEDESVSILSVNIIFEILSQFNLRDLLLPSK